MSALCCRRSPFVTAQNPETAPAGARRTGRDLVCLLVIPLLACAGTSVAPKNTRLMETNPLIPLRVSLTKAVRGMSYRAVLCQVWPSSAGIHSVEAVWDANRPAKGSACVRGGRGEEAGRRRRKVPLG